MRAIIHAGMHKTGSTSIQNTFAANTPEGFAYLPWHGPNHGGLLRLIADPEVGKYLPFCNTSDPERAVAAARAKWFPQVRAAFEPSATHHTVIFSAERLFPSSPQVKRNFQEFLRDLCSDVRVIAYIRPPASKAVSSVQQRLKTSDADARLANLWPHYRDRIEALDHVFGREAVELVLFSRDTLKNGDVVADFAERIGARLPPEDILQANVSLSLEAMAFLYVQRRYGTGLSDRGPGWRARNSAMINALASVGKRPARASVRFHTEMMNEHRADVEWMETRLGAPLPRTLTPMALPRSVTWSK